MQLKSEVHGNIEKSPGKGDISCQFKDEDICIEFDSK